MILNSASYPKTPAAPHVVALVLSQHPSPSGQRKVMKAQGVGGWGVCVGGGRDHYHQPDVLPLLRNLTAVATFHLGEEKEY